MSSIYHTEPQTQGKVVITTSYGDIDIELWPKECPLACRNFVQLCLEGYYDNSPIHLIVKQFMVQMGDPTGSGNGGDSIWGRPFKDEFHGRLKFNHRGQVAMANENAPHTNKSQFFITLGPCEWLNKKHTIFGKITGNTIFNLLRMGEADTDDKDRPTEKITFIKAEVLWNPFDDIIPRNLHAMKSAAKVMNKVTDIDVSKVPDTKLSKNQNLLSFADDEDDAPKEKEKSLKIKSLHDSMTASVSSKFSKDTDSALLTEIEMSQKKQEPSDDLQVSKSKDKLSQNSNDSATSHKPDLDSDSFTNSLDSKLKERMLEKRRKFENTSQGNNNITDSLEKHAEMDTNEMQLYLNNDLSQQKESILKKKQDEFNKLKEDLMRSKRAIKVLTGAEAEEQAKDTVLSIVEQKRQRYLKRKRDIGDRQEDTLSKLDKFKSKLIETKKTLTSESNEQLPVGEVYHGQILEQNDDIDDNPASLNDWHLGKLKFKKHIDDAYRTGSDGRQVDDYKVIDSRITNSSKSK